MKIQHPGDIETGYAHLSRFAEGLKVGDHVKRLQIIGYVGTTGRSTAPHLHFTAKKNGEFIDAETLNLDGMRVIAKDERDAFADVKRKYDELLDAIALPVVDIAPEAPVVAAAPAPAAPEEPGVGGPEEPEPARPPEPAAPATPAPAGGNRAPVFLSDKELLKNQASSDDGEVEE